VFSHLTATGKTGAKINPDNTAADKIIIARSSREDTASAHRVNATTFLSA
jgi:hypothetical protein